jgi:hypothetical protein
VLDAPLTLHPQVRVQGRAGVEAVQQVLAAGHDLEGVGAGEVGVGHPGPAQLGSLHDPAGERPVQALGGAVDGVALRHAA